MALNHFIEKTLGFNLPESKKSYVDPALKQGARFNKMQHEIIAGVLPDLPLMSQTTGPNLGSIVETLANRKSSQTALEKLDQKEFKTFQTEQDEFNKLLSDLATKHRDLKATEQGIISLDNLSSADYGVGAGKKIKDALFYQNADSRNDSDNIFVSTSGNNLTQQQGYYPAGNNVPEQEQPWRPGNQGFRQGAAATMSWAKEWCANYPECGGFTSNAPNQENQIIGETLWLKSKENKNIICNNNWVSFCKDGQCPDQSCPTEEDEVSELARSYRNQWGCGEGPCAKPSQLKDDITYLNGKIIAQANKIKARAQKLNKLDEKVENEMQEHEQQLRSSLKDLQNANNQKDNLIGSQQTLTGEVIDTRADLDSIYYHYLAWTIAAVTLGALSFHHLMKSR